MADIAASKIPPWLKRGNFLRIFVCFMTLGLTEFLRCWSANRAALFRNHDNTLRGPDQHLLDHIFEALQLADEIALSS